MPRIALKERTQPIQPSLSIADFLAFTASRPDEERWELIEGKPVLNASPVQIHQLIAVNIASALNAAKARLDAPWVALLGVGTIVPLSVNSLPQPDVYVQAGEVLDQPTTDDAMVIFEILSPSNRKADQAWRQQVYASVPNCLHYVTVSLKRPEVSAYDRVHAWKVRKVSGLGASLDLPGLNVGEQSLKLALADIYRYTLLGSN